MKNPFENNALDGKVQVMLEHLAGNLHAGSTLSARFGKVWQ